MPFTLEMLRGACALAQQRSIEQNEHGDYMIFPRPDQLHDIRCMQARDDWKDYYRSVRTLRRLRLRDQKQFRRLSQAWWHGYYKDELRALYPKDGRFGWENTPLEKRLEWFKLKKKAIS